MPDDVIGTGPSIEKAMLALTRLYDVIERASDVLDESLKREYDYDSAGLHAVIEHARKILAEGEPKIE